MTRNPPQAAATNARTQRAKPVRSLRAETIQRISDLIRENATVDRSMPGWGKLHIDRQLPFLFVYRRPRDIQDPGTERLVVGEASYLTAPPDRGVQKSVKALAAEIARLGVEIFGGFLIVEVWSGDRAPGPGSIRADFRIYNSGLDELQTTVAAFAEELQSIRIHRRRRFVEVIDSRRLGPPGRSPLISPRIPGVYTIGIEALPVYRAGPDGPVYPLLLRELHRGISVAFKKATFHFARALTTHRPKHFHALGRRIFVKAVWEVDRQLAEVGDSFDFLLAVSPVNAKQAFASFKKGGCEKAPRFRYPNLGISPTLLKRKLFAIPVERIEDPEVAYILRQKQDELDRQLTGLGDRGTFRFVHESVQIFGGAEPELVKLAQTILARQGERSEDRALGGSVDAEGFAARAHVELSRYKQAYPKVDSTVFIRDDINSLMVSRGNLLIPRELKVPAFRVEALIQHEVGTHVLTYFNGKAQPFQQFYLGLAGYDGLQEGIAVLAEYLVGGLTPARLRLLAARVAAVRAMLDGASFVDVFRTLTRQYGFSESTAFTIATRVFRGGGLTKDAAYLRGLVEVLKHLRGGGAIEPLLVGKYGSDHLTVVQELLRRKALRPPPLKPSYLRDPEALKRLDAVVRGATVLDLIPRREW